MADETEALEPEVIEETPEEEVEAEAKEESEEVDSEDEEEVDFVSFGDEPEEEGSAPEPESSTFRELRKRNREMAKKLAEYEAGANSADTPELGPEPQIEDFGYDQDEWKVAYAEWDKQRLEVEAVQQQAEQERKKQAEEWDGVKTRYEESKANFKLAGYDEAEAEVFGVLPNEVQATILASKKPVELVYALSRDPDKLEQLSKLNLLQAALMVGELGVQVKMGKRKLPKPDRPVRGAGATESADKHLERLEAAADKSGDRSEVIAYKAKLRSKAA